MRVRRLWSRGGYVAILLPENPTGTRVQKYPKVRALILVRCGGVFHDAPIQTDRPADLKVHRPKLATNNVYVNVYRNV